MLQGIFMMIISAPIIVAAAAENTDITALAIAGSVIWLVGFYFEAVGDYQLTKFLKKKQEVPAKAKKGKKGKRKKGPEFMTNGLWRFTRHPNYFGEVTQWWGLWVVVVGSSYGLYAVVSPLAITWLLLKVSGIPMLEKKWEDNKEFKKYKKRTNAFFPGPPRRK